MSVKESEAVHQSEDETINIFENSETLSSLSSDLQLKAKLSVHTFYPKFQPTPSMFVPSEPLASKSEETQLDVPATTTKVRRLEKLQTLDEIFLELDEQKDKKPPISAMRKERKDSKEKSYDSDDSSTEQSLRGSISNRKKTISWKGPSPTGRRSRGSSPVPSQSSRRSSPSPVPKPNSPSPNARSNSPPPTPSLSGALRSSLSMQQLQLPSSVESNNPPPLPYNIRAKKKNARRIQSIHFMVEPNLSSSVPSSDFGSESERDRSDSALPSPTHQEAATFGDPGTTSDSGSSWRHPLESDENMSTGASTLSRMKTMLVPCRLGESSLIDLSMLPKPFTVKDQLRLAMLLSTQESKYGFNMFDAMIPGDNDEITRLMTMGIRYEDAVLIIFEKRYVTKPHEGLRSSPVPIPEYKPHNLSSIPSQAATQLGEELSRSLSPKPRPQSMPVTSHSRDYRDQGNYNYREVATHRSLSSSPVPHSNPNEVQGYYGDYGLSQHNYPGYVTYHKPGGSLSTSRTHSPHPDTGAGHYSNSVGTSRIHSPHPDSGKMNNNHYSNGAPMNNYSGSVGTSRTHSPHHDLPMGYHYPGSVATSQTHSPHPDLPMGYHFSGSVNFSKSHIPHPEAPMAYHHYPASTGSSRGHSPHRDHGMVPPPNYGRNPGSLETSRSVTPNPPFPNLERPSSNAPSIYTDSTLGYSTASPNRSPYASGTHSRSYSPLPNPPVDIMPPKSYSFSAGGSRSHSPVPSANTQTKLSPQQNSQLKEGGSPLSQKTSPRNAPVQQTPQLHAPVPQKGMTSSQYALTVIPSSNVVRVDPNQSQANSNVPVSRGIALPLMGKVSSPKNRESLLL